MVGGNEYPAAKFNHQLGVIADHVRALSQLALRTWDPFATMQPAATDDDNFFGMFAHSRDADRTSRIYVFGTDNAQTALRAWWSPNGNIWHGTSHAGSGQILDMAANADGSVVIAVGTGMGNKVQRSTDGTTFAEVATHLADNYRSVCYSGGAFYAIQAGSTTPKIGKSTDGSVWAATAAQPFTFHTPGLCRAGKVGGVDAVLVCASSTSYVSVDGGLSWSAPGTIAGGAEDIRYSEALGLWMAVSAGLRVHVSADGVTWTETHAASIGSLVTGTDGVQRLACDDGGAWVVSGLTTGSFPCPFVAYSVDAGVTWTGVQLDEGNSFAGVCWHPVQQRFYVCIDPASDTRPAVLFRTPSYGTGGGLLV